MGRFLDDSLNDTPEEEVIDGNTGVDDSNIDGNSSVSTTTETNTETSDEDSNALINQAEELVRKVDDILQKVIQNKEIKSLGGFIDQKIAAIGYLTATIAIIGVDKTAQWVGVSVSELNIVVPFLRYIETAGKVVGETGLLIPLAILIWSIKTWGANRVANVLAKDDQSLKDLKDPKKKSWSKVGAAFQDKFRNVFGPQLANKIGIQIAKRGGWVGLIAAALTYRSQIYGAGRAIFDRWFNRYEGKEMPNPFQDSPEHKAFVDNFNFQEQLNNQQQTQQNVNKGGYVRKPYIKRKGIMRL